MWETVIVLLTNLSDIFFRVFVLNKPTQTQNKTNFKQSMQTATEKMQTNIQTQPVNRYCIYTYIRYSLESREKELFFWKWNKKKAKALPTHPRRHLKQYK